MTPYMNLTLLAHFQWGSHTDSPPPKFIMKYMCGISSRSIEKPQRRSRTNKRTENSNYSMISTHDKSKQSEGTTINHLGGVVQIGKNRSEACRKKITSRMCPKKEGKILYNIYIKKFFDQFCQKQNKKNVGRVAEKKISFAEICTTTPPR